MTQCVPSWDLDDNPTPIKLNFSNSSNSFTDVPSLDYEVAELTWENGQLAMYGLSTPRVAANKPAAAAAWEKPRATDTLECIVNQATAHPHPKAGGGGGNNKLVPWLDNSRRMAKPAASAALDALVPCNNSLPGTGTCMAGSCSGAPASVGGGCLASASESATCGGRDSQQVTLDSSEREFGGGGLTSTSLWSPENTSSGKDYTKTSGEDHDSVCHGKSQRHSGEKAGNRKGIGKSSISAKSRAAVHNQSERRRRDKINQRMKTLQKLVPNSSKTDKASMLDEVIEYLKQLQAQINMMSRMNMPSMMMPMPMPMQHQFQMPMMAPGPSMGIGMGAMGMGMGMGVMDINAIGRAAGMPPMPTPAAFMQPWDVQAGGERMHFPPLTPDLMSAFFACQSQPTTMDAYSRMAALYMQQIQQSSAASASKN